MRRPLAVLDQPVGRLLQRIDRLAQADGDGGHVVAGAVLQGLDRFADFGEQGARRRAAVADHLAADEVVGLDAVGALVDRRDPGIAEMLGRAGLLDEAHAAMDLDAERGDLDAEVGAPGLDHGGQQVGQRLALGGLGGVGLPLGDVERGRRVICQGAGTPRSGPAWSSASGARRDGG